MCSLLLSLLSDPSGSSDSLHSGSPSVRPRLLSLSLSLPVVCQCLSPSSPSLSLPLALLSGFFPQEPAEVPPGRRFCPTRTDCRNPRTAAYEPARSPVAAAWTRVPPLPPPPPPPPPRRGRPRPDSLSPARFKKKKKKKPPHDEGRATFPLCFLRTEEGGRAERGDGEGKKKEILDTKPSVKRWLVIYEDEQEVSAAVP